MNDFFDDDNSSNNDENDSVIFDDGNGYGNGDGNNRDGKRRDLPKEEKNRCIKICVAIAVIATIINMAASAVFRQNIAKSITQKLSEQIKNEVTAEITDDILEQYKREYNIPEGSETIGTRVYATSGESVVEIYCESTGSTSAATGIILNEQGCILTNAHVVTYEQQYRFGFSIETRSEKHEKVYIRLLDEDKWRECDIVDYNIEKDLAVIKLKEIPQKALKPIKMADSDRVNLGEGAVIIGNAYGLGISVTTGTITNKNPKNLKETRDIIQTDTAINSGNSGGPVFNMFGECIGVATYKIVGNNSSATTEGLGFALSSNFAKEYLDDKGVEYCEVDYNNK